MTARRPRTLGCVVPARLTAEQARRLDVIATALEWRRSEVIRRAVDHLYEDLAAAGDPAGAGQRAR